jgi:hypothetical protein
LEQSLLLSNGGGSLRPTIPPLRVFWLLILRNQRKGALEQGIQRKADLSRDLSAAAEDQTRSLVKTYFGMMIAQQRP